MGVPIGGSGAVQQPGDDVENAAPNNAPPGPRLGLTLEHADRVNFAMHQFGSPLVERVSMTNLSADAVEDLEVTLSLASDAARPWSGRVSRIEPDATYTLEPAEFRVDSAALADRTEAERTDLLVSVRGEGLDHTETHAIELLPFDHWPGASSSPHLLAAFITPNHPSIAELLGASRERLRELSGTDALDGYQSRDRRRVAQIANACFDSVSALGIGYINPPAGFESSGQRIRLTDRVLRERLGTCLDLSLMLAGMWEQAGLHPLIVLLRDHAFPAVWLEDRQFGTPFLDDPAQLRNAIALGSIVPAESTALTEPGVGFDEAMDAARRALDACDGRALTLDVRAARKIGARPLPLRVEGGVAQLDPTELETAAPAGRPASIGAIDIAERADRAAGGGEPEHEAPADRIDRWKRKLLDLSLRNRLLNFRETGRVAPLSVPAVAPLEDLLADGKRLELLPRLGAEGDAVEATAEFLADELESLRVRTTLTEAEHAKRLLNLYRLAGSAISETGANILFLALGALRWYESASSEHARVAPLILIPVALERRSTGGGYRYAVEHNGEELTPNVTLIEKLASQFGFDTAALGDLPTDESGIDVDLVLHRFREVIRDTPRWEVVETAHLGLFSFNKFLMWRDLEKNHDRLRRNRLVDTLVSPAADRFESDELPTASRLDEEHPPGDLLCTRDADSSQLAAVLAASQGRTFVLQGPPGTGKSQTIANIVADSLARGKRVLFVSEKVAALDVVHRRLDQDGLGPFCLELHSAKASKKEVLAQLGAALDALGDREPSDWATVCAELAEKRSTLNRYVGELHEPRASGESIYSVMGRLARLGAGPTAPAPDDTDAVAPDGLRAWRQHVQRLMNAAEPIDPPAAHPYLAVQRTEQTFALPDQLREALGRASERLAALREQLDRLVRTTAGEGSAATLTGDAVEAAIDAASRLESCPEPQPALLEAPEWETARPRLLEIIRLGRQRDDERTRLLSDYRPELLELDLLLHLDRAKRAATRPPILRWFACRGAVKAIRHLCLGATPGITELIRDLELAQSVKSRSAELRERSDQAKEWFGETAWNSGEPDWDALERDIDWANGFRAALTNLSVAGAPEGLRAGLLRLATDRDERSRALGETLDAPAAWRGWQDAWAGLAALLSVDESAVRQQLEGGWLEAARSLLSAWGAEVGGLGDWLAWRRTRDEAAAAGLDGLIRAYEQGDAERPQLLEAFERGFGGAWLPNVADSVPEIRSFNAHEHARTREAFQRLDRLLIERTQQLVGARLASRTPSMSSDPVPSSEMGILRRELEKRARHLPTRQLIERLPTLLPRLKPCFLMSPLSVAQYLDTDLPPFDIVVFDEASQIPVWDSIGALARGAEAVVVGDSKQLPPTAFFAAIDDEDDDPEELPEQEDLESILQECEASGVPTMRLAWHYRSRHESLIAFSNHHYYDNRLHTFPSPVDRSDTLGVTLRHLPEAVYDRGGSRTNRVEAEAVVEEIVRRLRLGAEQASIGVVTFGTPQQALIEDLLDAARRDDPSLEPFFTEGDEPVFVKNLENVQGDERDTIIFSVGYGRDQHGRMSMNFGPLNQSGGERRLNVAITRARRRLLVFSSILADDIDTRRTQAVGVRHFRTFLDYARRGPKAIAEASEATRDKAFDSGFERAVHDALAARGWDVDTQVGCAGYRIDLAIRHPDRPGRYALGIECDGATYHSAPTARDRDRIRQSVLEGLGWRIARVWSTDWHVDADRCVAHLEESLRAALLDEPAAPPPDPEPRPSAEPPSPPDADAEPPRKVIASAPAGPAERSSSAAPVYRVATPQRPIAADVEINDPSTHALALECIGHIVAAEAPIVPELALRRLAGWFGVQRISERTRSTLEGLIREAEDHGLAARLGDALWPPGTQDQRIEKFRTPGDDPDAQRDLDQVPLTERVAAVRWVLASHFGMPRTDLEREAARVFGARRLTDRVQALMAEPVDRLIADGEATLSDDHGVTLADHS